MIYLDTHVVAWLYGGQLSLIPAPVKTRLESDDILISPMVLLELEYLFEVGRARDHARVVVDSLARAIGLGVCDLPLAEVVGCALSLTWTRDPFDRLIVAHAMFRGADLATRDGTIRKRYPRALWDDASIAETRDGSGVYAAMGRSARAAKKRRAR